MRFNARNIAKNLARITKSRFHHTHSKSIDEEDEPLLKRQDGQSPHSLIPKSILLCHDSGGQIPLPPSLAPSQKHFPFLALPAEVRIDIYTLLVCPGRVYYDSPPSNAQMQVNPRYPDLVTTPPPALTLFRVNKQIQAEAEHEYATRNIFVLPSTWVFCRPCLPHARPLMSARAWAAVHALSLSFDTSAMTLGDVLPDTSALSWMDRSGDLRTLQNRWTGRNRRGRANATHNLMTTFALNQLVDKMRDLYVLLGPGVRALEVDVASAFCPMADHRLVESVGKYLTILPLPERIDVFGAWGIEEMAAFGVEVRRNMLWGRRKKFCLHFHGEGGVRWFAFEGSHRGSGEEDRAERGCSGEHPQDMRLCEKDKYSANVLSEVYYPVENLLLDERI